MKTKLILFILVVLTIISCSRIDNSNPKSVLEGYMNFKAQKDYKKGYELIASQSKSVINQDEFVKYYEFYKDTVKNITLITTGITELEKDYNHPTYRRYKVESMSINKSDTTKEKYYVTLINENNEWKICWNSTIIGVAGEKFNKGDYNGSIGLYKKAIELDPFDAYSHLRIAWCLSASDEIFQMLTHQKILSEIHTNIEYAISLEPDIARNYNGLAMYYGYLNDEKELAIEAYNKALHYCLNKKEKSRYYANMSISYQKLNDYENAILYIEKAIQADSSKAFTWMRYGHILLKLKDFNNAHDKFSRSLSLKPMENRLMDGLFFGYASTCYHLGKNDEAKEYILKALELNPKSLKYKQLYHTIKKLQTLIANIEEE